jgi:polysaccharide biosynthesis transport protein
VQIPSPAQAGPSPYGQVAEYYATQPAEGGIDVKDLLAVLRRRRWVIMTTVLVITTLAVLAGLQITPKYTAKTMVMIDARHAKVMDVEAVMSGISTDASSVETQMKVIKSRALAEQVTDKLRLQEDPEFNPALRKSQRGAELKVAGPLEAVLGWVPDEWLIASGLASEPVVGSVSKASGEREDVIDRFDTRLKVAQEGRSYVMGISFTSVDPDKAAKVANILAHLYVQN